MARFNDENVPAAVQSYLQPGEQLQNWAYGVKQPHVLLIALTGAILTALLTKSYIVALTDRRLLVLRFEGALKVSEVTEYPLSPPPQASGSRGMLFTRIRINDPAKPFVAKFHRMGMPNNRAHSTAILAALTGVAA